MAWRGRFELVTGERVEAGEALDAFAEELNAQAVLGVGGELDGIAADAELAAVELDVVAGVLEVDEFSRSWSRVISWFDAEGDDHGLVILLAADAVDAGDAGDHDHVAPGEQRAHGREPQAFDLLVDAGILFDEGVGAGM
jgi:hypothetical protein